MKTSRFVNAPFLPSLWDFTFQLFIPDHLAARGLIRLAVLVGKVELDKPIVINCLRECLKFGDLLAVQFNLFVDTSENGRYVQFIKLPGDALADEQPGGVWRGEVLVE